MTRDDELNMDAGTDRSSVGLRIGKFLALTFGVALSLAVPYYSIILVLHAFGVVGQALAESHGAIAATVVIVCALPAVVGFIMLSSLSPDRRIRRTCAFVPLILIGILAVAVMVAALCFGG
jgi:hypothetical protein